MSFTKYSIVVAAMLVASNAHAASVTWTPYDSSELGDARTDRANLETNFQIGFEDFEGFSTVPNNGVGVPGTTATPLMTDVGLFTTHDGDNNVCGGSCDTPEDESLVRSSSNFGRYNTTVGGSNWLDSNDNSEISVNVSGLAGMFDNVSFFVTDVDDVGSDMFSITVGDDNPIDIAALYAAPGAHDDGDLFYISLHFDLTDSILITFNIDDGDGYGIDDFRVGSSVAPVPVPATLPLLAAGIGLMGWTSRRRKQNA